MFPVNRLGQRTPPRLNFISPGERNSWLASRSAVTSSLKDIKLIARIYGARIARGGILEFPLKLVSNCLAFE